jgi:glycosyltransferase involved in cell wall biosynthesis
MKIGFDAKRAYQNFTGLGNYSRDLIENLITDFPENKYALFAPKDIDSPRLEFLLEHQNVSSIFPENKLNKTFKGLWRTINMEKSIIKNEIDLYHGLSNEIPRIKNKNIPYVVTIHDLIFKRFPRNYRTIDRKVYNTKYKYAVKHCDLTIAISEQTKKDIIEFYKIPAERIKVIYQSCHKNFRKNHSIDEMDRIKKKFNLPSSFLLNVGTIETRKNLIAVVNALHVMKTDIPLVVIGRKTAYMNFIKIQAKKLKFDINKIIFLNDVSIEELPVIYKLASLFVFPSIFEGFGIPILESLCSGTPVISSKGSCFSEAGGAHSKYVDPNNIEEFAFQIEECLVNTELRKTMSKMGLEHARNFEPKTLSNQLNNVYKNLL